MNNNYYSDTAYDSTKPRDLPAFSRTDLGLAQRTIRKHPITIKAAQCREYFARSNPISTILDLQHLTPKEHQQMLDRKIHEYFQRQTGQNKAAVVESVVFVAAYFWMVGIFAVLIAGFLFGFDEALFIATGLTVVFPFTIWSIGKTALKRGWVKDQNNVMFNRKTGMITLPWFGEMVDLPYVEFDAFMSASTMGTGGTNMALRLVHRYSDKNIVNPAQFGQSCELYSDWEEIQHFMDISKPLPDTPMYDWVRQYDPVTAEYDKKNNRPTDYWKNHDIKKLNDKWRASIEAGKRYPWGEPREQALQSGWKPSGYGEGDWRETPKDKDDKNKDNVA